MSIHKRVRLLLPLMCCLSAFSQSPAHVEMAKVESRSSARTVPLTAELAPFLQTDIEARSLGYVAKVLVDRGSMVHRGQLLVQLSAPEINSQTSVSEANLHQAEAVVLAKFRFNNLLVRIKSRRVSRTRDRARIAVRVFPRVAGSRRENPRCRFFSETGRMRRPRCSSH